MRCFQIFSTYITEDNWQRSNEFGFCIHIGKTPIKYSKMLFSFLNSWNTGTNFLRPFLKEGRLKRLAFSIFLKTGVLYKGRARFIWTMLGLANRSSWHVQLRENPGVEFQLDCAAAKFSYGTSYPGSSPLIRDCSFCYSFWACFWVFGRTERCSSLDRKPVVLFLELAVVLGDP